MSIASTFKIMGRGAAIAALLFFVKSPAFASSYTLLLSTSIISPGQTLRLELDDALTTTHLQAVFQGKAYPFYAVGPNAQRALIGVKLGSTPGHFPLKIRCIDPKTTEAETSTDIEIATKTYVVENINFSEEKTSLTRWENKESAKIHKTALIASHDQAWEGIFNPPVQGIVLAPFGLHRLRNGTQDAGYHKGIDLRAAKGTPVLAANAGRILIAHTFKAHGKTIMIDHGQGVMTIYLHMSVLLVKPGDEVTKGQEIGKVGATGLATGPHVHWQVFVHSVPVDPNQWTSTEF